MIPAYSYGVYSDAEEPAVCSVCPQGPSRQKAADLFISFAARDTEIEKTYLLSTRLSLRTEPWSVSLWDK